MSIDGIWRGSYFYDLEVSGRPDGFGTGFELRLRQAWWQRFFGGFTGSVTDDPEHGMPGVGHIHGTLRGAVIRFTKQMPNLYALVKGRPVSLRDHLRTHGYDHGRDIPHRPILYCGHFTDDDNAAGAWRIPAGPLHLTSRLSLPMQECTGTWTLARGA